MERRFVLFLVLSFTVLIGYYALLARLNPQPPRKPKPAAEAPADDDDTEKEQADPDQAKPQPGEDQPGEDQPGEDQPGQDQPAPEDPDKPAVPQPPQAVEAKPKHPLRWVVLGSADPDDPYRMLVTLTSQGAAVEKIELNSPRYRDLEDRSGYLGQVVMDPDAIAPTGQGKGCLVQVVGPGTPAAEAGLLPPDPINKKPGDLIVKLNETTIASVRDLRRALAGMKPKKEVTLTVLRDGKQKVLKPVKLIRRPLALIQPEADDPLSFLLTLSRIDGQKFIDDDKADEEVDGRAAHVNRELPGLDLRRGNWQIDPDADQDHVTFRRRLPGLVITKTYRFEKRIPEESIKDRDYRAYHLVLDVEIHNDGTHDRQVAYQLDGPTGLPIEGWWYSKHAKIGRDWGGVGLRDVVARQDGDGYEMIGCPTIVKEKAGPPREDSTLRFVGVDAQYFSAVLIPKKQNDPFASWQPLRVGRVNSELDKLTNTSCRLTSRAYALKAGKSIEHRFEIFAGPKRPPLLEKYGLDELVYYGWFWWAAKPMVTILHFFHDYVVFSYGLAILMLTAVVRGCMFPLSKKQALGAQKMQELQPEIKKIQEKYKKDMEGRTKAQQELFRKHNYNPLSGCLVLFVQLPIFIALYRSLMVDIELRQSPLLTDSIRWCSNLSAPDMLIDWSGFMPAFIGGRFGWLGPYFNLLPIFTVILFVVQQKMFMPPPADEQAAMQQKIMKYMMVFMGFLFFKVASGLCLYFIASSLWGLAERKFLPKSPAKKPEKPPSRADAKADAKAQAKAEAKPPPKPGLLSKLTSSPTDGDGAAARRKKKKGNGKRGKR